ncbi:hypothetical protein [Micromonospora saelicesensis]|uniref:hypothetical protein n=1 Tax=Micromonospora saelicesensis TaxID=285676 RepID=UPI000DC4E800|nr:hypothetical protein [Micromonospora saelicesensis]RAO63624.1 hypothetical protein PSN01_00346 [Micromonospora saelicesensis]
MKLRMLLIGAFAALLATLAVPSVATAAPADHPIAGVTTQSANPANAIASDNPNAGISGVSSQAVGPCPYTAVCVYTDTYFGGRMFVLYQCRWYSLTNWNGWGSIYNNQTWGAWADIMDQNRNPIRGFSSGVAWEAVDFSPVWYIRMC